MTAIHQSPISNNHSIDERGQHSGHRNGASAEHGNDAMDNSTENPGSSTVNISFQATMRLRAYQETRMHLSANQEMGSLNHHEAEIKKQQGLDKLNAQANEREQGQTEQTVSSALQSQTGSNGNNLNEFPLSIENMLSEVQDNLVQKSEPGYRHLVNLLQNHGTTIEDSQQLQEIMRKEQFYLGRRRAFMNNSDYQSYSQVLNQFSNIVERQQYSF